MIQNSKFILLECKFQRESCYCSVGEMWLEILVWSWLRKWSLWLDHCGRFGLTITSSATHQRKSSKWNEVSPAYVGQRKVRFVWRTPGLSKYIQVEFNSFACTLGYGTCAVDLGALKILCQTLTRGMVCQPLCTVTILLLRNGSWFVTRLWWKRALGSQVAMPINQVLILFSSP